MSLRDDFITALIAAHIPSPRMETDIILKASAPNFPEISPKEEKAARDMLSRRLKHEPLDKILGKKEFYKFTFKVNKDVLSPRPDTEILVESALALIDKAKPCRILDLGTGSGCIILSLLKECPHAKGVGLDISDKALNVAKENARVLEVSNRVEFVNASWNDRDFAGEMFDIIVSNPPYISKADIKSLSSEVKDYDPFVALSGGEDGLACYREIANLAPKLLKKDGCILLESGYGQDENIKEIFIKAGLSHIKTVLDLANINRCVILKK